MPKPYRVTAFVRLNNAFTSAAVRLGVNLGSFALLTVRGRKSGKPIATPVAVFDQDGKRYLIASYGVVNWVRNLRAAGGEATLTSGRRSERIRAVELAPRSPRPSFATRCALGRHASPRRSFAHTAVSSSSPISTSPRTRHLRSASARR